MSDGENGRKWQVEFPYRWDHDDAVTRRELLHFAVYTSGALFAGTAGIAVLSRLRAERPQARTAIAREEELARARRATSHIPRVSRRCS